MFLQTRAMRPHAGDNGNFQTNNEITGADSSPTRGTHKPQAPARQTTRKSYIDYQPKLTRYNNMNNGEQRLKRRKSQTAAAKLATPPPSQPRRPRRVDNEFRKLERCYAAPTGPEYRLHAHRVENYKPSSQPPAFKQRQFRPVNHYPRLKTYGLNQYNLTATNYAYAFKNEPASTKSSSATETGVPAEQSTYDTTHLRTKEDMATRGGAGHKDKQPRQNNEGVHLPSIGEETPNSRPQAKRDRRPTLRSAYRHRKLRKNGLYDDREYRMMEQRHNYKEYKTPLKMRPYREYQTLIYHGGKPAGDRIEKVAKPNPVRPRRYAAVSQTKPKPVVVPGPITEPVPSSSSSTQPNKQRDSAGESDVAFKNSNAKGAADEGESENTKDEPQRSNNKTSESPEPKPLSVAAVTPKGVKDPEPRGDKGREAISTPPKSQEQRPELVVDPQARYPSSDARMTEATALAETPASVAPRRAPSELNHLNHRQSPAPRTTSQPKTPASLSTPRVKSQADSNPNLYHDLAGSLAAGTVVPTTPTGSDREVGEARTPVPAPPEGEQAMPLPTPVPNSTDRSPSQSIPSPVAEAVTTAVPVIAVAGVVSSVNNNDNNGNKAVDTITGQSINSKNTKNSTRSNDRNAVLTKATNNAPSSVYDNNPNNSCEDSNNNNNNNNNMMIAATAATTTAKTATTKTPLPVVVSAKQTTSGSQQSPVATALQVSSLSAARPSSSIPHAHPDLRRPGALGSIQRSLKLFG